jgi:hypothetical protein
VLPAGGFPEYAAWVHGGRAHGRFPRALHRAGSVEQQGGVANHAHRQADTSIGARGGGSRGRLAPAAMPWPARGSRSGHAVISPLSYGTHLPAGSMTGCGLTAGSGLLGAGGRGPGCGRRPGGGEGGRGTGENDEGVVKLAGVGRPARDTFATRRRLPGADCAVSRAMCRMPSAGPERRGGRAQGRTPRSG